MAVTKKTFGLDPARKVLFDLNEAVDVKVNGNSGSLDTEHAKNVTWLANITALAGTSPSVIFSWENSPDNINWFITFAVAALTTVGFRSRVDTENLLRYVRVAWTKTGTITTGDATIYIQAK
jgi:hypothetical protein